MKKIVALLILSVMLFAASCGNAEDKYSDHRYSEYFYLEGYYLLAKNGSHMIVGDNQGPCVMSAADGVSFDGLTDGDRIKITTSVILESYPGQLTAYSLEKLSDGERSDIDEQTLKQLAELGWIEE